MLRAGDGLRQARRGCELLPAVTGDSRATSIIRNFRTTARERGAARRDLRRGHVPQLPLPAYPSGSVFRHASGVVALQSKKKAAQLGRPSKDPGAGAWRRAVRSGCCGRRGRGDVSVLPGVCRVSASSSFDGFNLRRGRLVQQPSFSQHRFRKAYSSLSCAAEQREPCLRARRPAARMQGLAFPSGFSFQALQ